MTVMLGITGNYSTYIQYYKSGIITTLYNNHSPSQTGSVLEFKYHRRITKIGIAGCVSLKNKNFITTKKRRNERKKLRR